MKRCAHCRFAAYRDEETMTCMVGERGVVRAMIVQRIDVCERFEREPGADDE